MDNKNKEVLGCAIKSWIARKRYKTMIVHNSNRDKVAKEILDTEQIYVRNLETIVQYYLKPLRNINPPLLSAKSIQIIFGHVEDLLSVNTELLTSIQDKMTTWYQDKRLGKEILKLAPYLKIYTIYCSNYDKAVARLKQKSDESKDLQLFLKRVATENSFGLDLISLLVTPIQRIPRYKLLLQSLIQFTPPEFSDYKVLNVALEEISLVANIINESIREKQNLEKILTIQKRFTGQCPPLLAPLRVFIREGSLTKVCRKDHKKRWFILFSDAIVYGNRIDTAVGNPIYKFHRLLPLSNAKISNLDDNKFKNSFQIIHPIKSFTLIADTEQEKSSWVNSFNDAQNSLSSNQGSVARMNKQYTKINVLKNDEDLTLSTAPVWIPDNEAVQCMECTIKFTTIRRRHHCRRCGHVVCGKCSEQKWTLDQYKKDARVCKTCYNYLSISTSRAAEGSTSTTTTTNGLSADNNTSGGDISPTTAILLTGGSSMGSSTFGGSLSIDIDTVTNISSDSDNENENSSINDSTSDMPIINGLSSIQIDNSPVIPPTPPTTTPPPTPTNNNIPIHPLPALPRPTSPKPFIVNHTAYNQENALQSTSPASSSLNLDKKSTTTTTTSTPTPTATTTTTPSITTTAASESTTTAPPKLTKTGTGNTSLLDFCKSYIQNSPNVSPAKVERHNSSAKLSTSTTSSPSHSRSTSTVSPQPNESNIVLPELKQITSDPIVNSISNSNSTSSNSIKVTPSIQHTNSSSKLNLATPQPQPNNNDNNNTTSSPPVLPKTTKSLPPTPPPKALPPTPPPKKLPPTPPSPPLHQNNTTPSPPQPQQPPQQPSSSPPLTPSSQPARPPKPPSIVQELHQTTPSPLIPSPPPQHQPPTTTTNVNSIYSSTAPAPPPKRIVSTIQQQRPTNNPVVPSTSPTLNGSNVPPPLPPPRIKSQINLSKDN